MPKAASSPTVDYYRVAVRQFTQQILPAPHRPTTVWGYGSTTDAGTFHSPAFTIEATVNRHVEVTWMNQLMDGSGNYLPHLLPVDQTVHWANPPGGIAGRDMHGDDPRPYRGPVPIVTHLHGGHTTDESDGYPEAWYLRPPTTFPRGSRRLVPGTTSSVPSSARGGAARGLRAPPGSGIPTTSVPQRSGTTIMPLV